MQYKEVVEMPVAKLPRWLTLVCMTFVLLACSPQSVLFKDLTEEDANEIYSVLLKAGIPAEKTAEKNGMSVQVPKSLSSDAFKVLAAKGLPRKERSSMGDVFKKESMISSPLEERARYLHALSQELERTLMNIDGVLTARVHLVLPERVNPGELVSPSSAAVYVKYVSDSNFPAYVPKVRELVFKSIPGIKGDPHSTITVAAIASDISRDAGVNLVWYGPLAMHKNDQIYFLALVYAFAGLWLLSIVIVWLQAAGPEKWPKFIQRLKARFAS